MKFRPQRGSLDAAMAEAREFADRAELVAHITERLWPWNFDVTTEMVHVKKYGPDIDERIGWDTYVVTVDGYGVFGFTDGPVPDAATTVEERSKADE
jgi:hypothetical protein